MKPIILPLAELKPALTGLGKLIARKSSLPVLNHLKIERTKDGWTALTATDLDHYVTVRLEQPGDGEPASFLVPYDELLKLTKNCSKSDNLLIRPEGENVRIEYAVGNQVAEATVGSLPVEEFPEIPRIKGELIPITDDLRKSVHQALDCASTDETRLVLNSAFIDVSHKDGHYVIGTNGSHLFSSNSFKLPLKDSVILPAHKFIGWKEFNSDGEWQFRIAPPQSKDIDGHIQVSSRRWRFITRQFDGDYPNWRQVIPGESSFATSIQFDEPDKLADTVERLPDHDAKDHTIGIERKKHEVNLLWKSDKEQPWKRLPVTHERLTGKDITIYINRIYLIKALRFGLSLVEFIDPMSPMRFRHEGRQMIVMPVRAESARPTATAAPEAQETASEPAAPEVAAQPERSTPMVNDTSNGSSNPTEPPTIDAQLNLIIVDAEAMRTVIQDHLTDIKTLCTRLKAFQREHKSSNKELSTIRQTLKGLQSVKL